MEHSPAWHELLWLDVELLHGISVQYVDAAPTIYQYAGESGSSSFCHEGGIQNQCIGARRRHHLWVIGLAPADGLLRPVHKLRVVGGDRVDFLLLSALAAPIFCLACKDDVGGMFIGELVLNSSRPLAERPAAEGLEAASLQAEAATAPRPWRFG